MWQAEAFNFSIYDVIGLGADVKFYTAAQVGTVTEFTYTTI
jgi:hypothetical protein